MDHDHHHGPRGLADGHLDRAMSIGVCLNLAFVAAELVAGFLSGSLSLLADAGHNAGDVLGLLLAWGAAWLSRRPPSGRYTWGLGRSTILAALANAILLLVACGAILWEAWHRLLAPAPVASTTVIVVAALGVVINTLTALLFRHGHTDANVRGAFLHMAADAAVSAGVVLAGIAIAVTGRGWIDPLVSVLIAVVIVAGTWNLLQESLELALDAVPRGVDVAAIHDALARVPGVAEVHDLHVWGPSTSEISLSAHLVAGAEADHTDILATATARVRHDFHVAHATLQIESCDASLTCPHRPDTSL
ncbi:MAG: cation transporter [Planctomycetes bacterium]|nr:cation transporter [Planctomycetota bacterium]